MYIKKGGKSFVKYVYWIFQRYPTEQTTATHTQGNLRENIFFSNMSCITF